MGANHNERLAYMRDRNLVFGRMRDRLAKSALYAWGAVLVMAFVNGGLAWKLADRPREYFGIDANGSLVPMLPLSEPSVSLTAILNFAVEGVTRAHTYSPLVWRRERQENARWFTPEGWAAFSRQLDRTGPDNQKIGLQALVERGVVVSAVPMAAPVVVEQPRVVGGILRVTVQFPMLVTYQGSGAPATEQLLVNATVTRRSLMDHPLGIGIGALTTRPYGGTQNQR